jgi:hypothetical protein
MTAPQLSSQDVRTDLSTRQAPLKWVIVVDGTLAAGRAANAAACLAAAVGKTLPGLLGPDVKDASGGVHPGLPWAGCSVLAAPAETLRALRGKAAARDDLLVVDMPGQAQTSRLYDEYTAQLGETAEEDFDYLAVSLVGPRNPVSRLVGGLPLFG